MIKDKLDSPVTTWFKYLGNNDIKCSNLKSTLSSTQLASMKCSFPSENFQTECPKQCQCSYSPYQSPLDLQGHILVNCSGQSSSIETLFIPKVLNEDITNVTLDISNTSLSSLSPLRNIQGRES